MCDLQEPRVWDDHTVTARKVHRCDDCREDISKGERYVAASGLYEDGWESFKFHVECRTWAAAYQTWHKAYWGDDCGAPLGRLVEYLWEAHLEMHGRGGAKRAATLTFRSVFAP